jgi:two-component system, cell cycle response regulator
MPTLILVADADPFNLGLLSELCASLGYDVATAADGGAVLDAVARERPRLVVMDVSLPVLDGYKVLRILKGDTGLSQLPVLLVTAEGDVEGRRRGLEMGAVDYLTKPFRTFEIQQRIRNVLRIEEARGRVSEAPDAVGAGLDAGLGAGTVGQLHISLDYEFTRAVRYGHPLSCVVVRCSNHAAILERSGAMAAERSMLPLATLLRSCIRGVDHLFRSADDAFTILLPETEHAGCEVVVRRLRSSVAAESAFDATIQPRPRVLVGAASYPQSQARDGAALWQAATLAGS